MNKQRTSKRMALLAGSLLFAVLSAPPFAWADAGFASTSGRPFDAGSAWNLPIPTNPALDARSVEIVSTLSSTPGVANLYAYGVPTYNAASTTPRYPVTCTKAWGTCPFAGKTVPIPAGASPSSGTDGAMVITDWSTGLLYEFYQYSWNGGSPVVGWGAVGPMTGAGRDNQEGRIGNSTGSGVSRLAGVVRTWELQQGRIDHALVFSTKYCEAPTANFRYPATKSDGKYTGTGSIQEGARIQLDPTINVDALPGITAAEKIVAKALQTYGAYNIDCGGANWAFIFEAPSGEADPYAGFGLTRDYFSMSHIPWAKTRVLKQWDGASPTVDTTAPVVKITTPTNNATVSRSVSITASSTDNVGVTKMQILADGRLLATSSTESISTSWSTRGASSGAHAITINSYDAAGNKGTATVTVYV